MKKGQAEMVGLAVIVILLIFALLFYVSFKSNNQRETELVRSSIRANNILNAVLLVNVGGSDMKSLLEECVESDNKNPSGTGLSDECSDVDDELDNIFSLLKIQNYWFGAFGSSTEDPIYEKGDSTCENFIKASSARFPNGYRYEFKLCHS